MIMFYCKAFQCKNHITKCMSVFRNVSAHFTANDFLTMLLQMIEVVGFWRSCELLVRQCSSGQTDV